KAHAGSSVRRSRSCCCAAIPTDSVRRRRSRSRITSSGPGSRARSIRLGKPRILCTGIAVLDEVFRVDEFPPPDGKAMASEFPAVGGGCAANAAVAIARLGGQASYAGPVGGPGGQEPISDRILAGLAAEGVDCTGCERLDGVTSALSAIFVNAR